MTAIAVDSVQPGVEPIIESQAQGAAKPEAGEDLEGIKKNRDELKTEKKALAVEKNKIQAELDKLKNEKEASTKTALLEQEKFKELFELEKAEKEKLSSQIVENKKEANYEHAAILAGVQPKFLKFVMTEMSQVDFDTEGNPTNAGAFFEGFKESYPQFFSPESGSVQIPKTDSATTNLTGTQIKSFTREEIDGMDQETWKKNEKEIDRQYQAGLIR